MMRSVIFDFDGVIVESAHIKTAAFRELFSRWPAEKANAGIAYHMRNTGITRYVKFRYFYENILKEQYTDEIEKKLAVQFETIVFDQVVSAPLVKGVREFLEKNLGKYKFFIASGTPEAELVTIARKKGVDHYFQRINGAPKTKKDIINSILQDFGYKNTEVVFIGDGESDLKAAIATGVNFIFRATNENQDIISMAANVINDLTQLEEKILLF